MSEILTPEDWDRALRDMIGTGLRETERAIRAYEDRDMRRAEKERLKSEACENGCQFMGYSPTSLRRIVYCWREGIDFYENLIMWKWRNSGGN